MSDFPIFHRGRFGEACFFVFCDHACNEIPPAYNGLGLPADLLETHIAYDLGAADTARRFAELTNGEMFSCGFSRLLVDPNRSPDAKDFIPSVADQIPIPGNQMLSETEMISRKVNFHQPYHDALGAAIDEFLNRTETPFIVSIHSFTARLMGAPDERIWPIGLLWRDDEASALEIRHFLENKTGWPIGDNEPYDARVFNYSVDRHISARNVPHVTIEIRQDMIKDDDGVEKIASLLASAALHAAQSRSTIPPTGKD